MGKIIQEKRGCKGCDIRSGEDWSFILPGGADKELVYLRREGPEVFVFQILRGSVIC